MGIRNRKATSGGCPGPSIHALEYYTAMKNPRLPLYTASINLTNAVLYRTNLTQNATSRVIPCIRGLKTGKTPLWEWDYFRRWRDPSGMLEMLRIVTWVLITWMCLLGEHPLSRTPLLCVLFCVYDSLQKLKMKSLPTIKKKKN